MKKIFLLIIAMFVMNIVNAQWLQLNVLGTQISGIAVKDTCLFVSTYDSGLYVSKDNGLNWTARNNGLTYINLNHVALNNTDFLISGYHHIGNYYDNFFLASSIDNGLNWTVTGTDGDSYFLRADSLHIMEIGFVSDMIGYWLSVSNLTYNPHFDYFEHSEYNPSIVAVC